MNPQTVLTLALGFVGGVASANVLWNQLHDPALIVKFVLAFALAMWLWLRNSHRWAAVAIIVVSAGIAVFEACHQQNPVSAALYLFVYAFVVFVELKA